MVFIPKFTSKGEALTANRWVNILGLAFQPSELLKFTLVLFVADFLSKKSVSDLNNWTKTIIPLGLFMTPAIVLIYMQPATSIIILFLIAVGAMCFSLKLSTKILFPIAILLVLLLGIFILLGGKGTEYRKDRLTNKDDYQRRQSIIGIVRGGVIGVGFGQSRQKYNYLPQSYTDSIYAVIAEEFGFLGTALILALYFSL
jgi:cell division protein FtsW